MPSSVVLVACSYRFTDLTTQTLRFMVCGYVSKLLTKNRNWKWKRVTIFLAWIILHANIQHWIWRLCMYLYFNLNSVLLWTGNTSLSINCVSYLHSCITSSNSNFNPRWVYKNFAKYYCEPLIHKKSLNYSKR